MRFLILRIVLPIVLFYLLRAVLKTFFTSAKTFSPSAQAENPSKAAMGGELKKDPVCGTYVSVAGSLTRTVGGEVLHFCSRECRDKYRVA